MMPLAVIQKKEAATLPFSVKWELKWELKEVKGS